MHTRKVVLALGVGLFAAQVQGCVAAPSALACDPAQLCPTPAPVVVTPGLGHGGGVVIGVTSPGGVVNPQSGGSGSALPIVNAGGGPGVQNGVMTTNPYVPSPDLNLLLGALQAQCQAAPLVNPLVPCSSIPPQQPSGAATPPPAPPSIVLALSAWGQLVMPAPKPSRYPTGVLTESGHPYTVVNANTWFWTDPATFQPVSKTVTAGAVWGTATATPVSLTFTPGDGSHPVTCKGPGQAWQPNDQVWLPPANPQGCSYRYPNSSLGVGGDDQVTATYTITWTVTWTGSDGTSGAFNGMQTQSASRFAVAEAQTVVVR